MDSPEKPAVSSAALTPSGFYSQKLWGFIFLALEPWAVQSVLGLGSLVPKVSLPIFIYHTWMWDPLFCWPLPCSLHLATTTPCPLPLGSLPPPLLPIWMNMTSLNFWLLDFHTVWYSGSSGCFLFLGYLRSFFWLCKEAKYVCLCLHLDKKSCAFLNIR